jgi:hypothetical protein
MYQWTTARGTRRREPWIHAPATPITTDSTMQIAARVSVMTKPRAKRARSNAS